MSDDHPFDYGEEDEDIRDILDSSGDSMGGSAGLSPRGPVPESATVRQTPFEKYIASFSTVFLSPQQALTLTYKHKGNDYTVVIPNDDYDFNGIVKEFTEQVPKEAKLKLKHDSGKFSLENDSTSTVTLIPESSTLLRELGFYVGSPDDKIDIQPDSGIEAIATVPTLHSMCAEVMGKRSDCTDRGAIISDLTNPANSEKVHRWLMRLDRIQLNDIAEKYGDLGKRKVAFMRDEEFQVEDADVLENLSKTALVTYLYTGQIRERAPREIRAEVIRKEPREIKVDASVVDVRRRRAHRVQLHNRRRKQLGPLPRKEDSPHKPYDKYIKFTPIRGPDPTRRIWGDEMSFAVSPKIPLPTPIRVISPGIPTGSPRTRRKNISERNTWLVRQGYADWDESGTGLKFDKDYMSRTGRYRRVGDTMSPAPLTIRTRRSPRRSPPRTRVSPPRSPSPPRTIQPRDVTFKLPDAEHEAFLNTKKLSDERKNWLVKNGYAEWKEKKDKDGNYRHVFDYDRKYFKNTGRFRPKPKKVKKAILAHERVKESAADREHQLVREERRERVAIEGDTSGESTEERERALNGLKLTELKPLAKQHLGKVRGKSKWKKADYVKHLAKVDLKTLGLK